MSCEHSIENFVGGVTTIFPPPYRCVFCEIKRLQSRLALLEPFAEIMDDEFMRQVAGYGYDVPRLHRAWMRVREESAKTRKEDK